jgi:hypothetical protein
MLVVGRQKTRMLHNIAAQFGLKWILWNDLIMENCTLNFKTQQTELAKHTSEFVGVQ